MESAYGYSLNENDRCAITDLVKTYFIRQPFEAAAPFLQDSQQWLQQTRQAAQNFSHLLLKAGNLSNPLKSDAAFFAQREIGLQLKRIEHMAPVVDVEILRSAIDYFIIANVKAEETLTYNSEKAGKIEGNAWAEMVQGIVDLFERANRPVTASKGTGKAKHDKPSAFVGFIFQLQATFPDALKRHNHSFGALAEAITQVKKLTREAKSGARWI